MNAYFLYQKVVKKIKRTYFINFNKLKLRFSGVCFGTKCNFYNSIQIEKNYNSTINIGDNVTITSGLGINPLSRNLKAYIRTEKNASIRIGKNSGLSSCCLWSQNSICIGENVNIGAGTSIIDTDRHSLDWRVRSSNELINGECVDQVNCKTAPIYIGNNVLIGAYCIILKGVTIGDRAIIGAGSVVTHDIPADSIAAGNPCKVVKHITD